MPDAFLAHAGLRGVQRGHKDCQPVVRWHATPRHNAAGVTRTRVPVPALRIGSHEARQVRAHGELTGPTGIERLERAKSKLDQGPPEHRSGPSSVRGTGSWDRSDALTRIEHESLRSNQKRQQTQWQSSQRAQNLKDKPPTPSPLPHGPASPCWRYPFRRGKRQQGPAFLAQASDEYE